MLKKFFITYQICWLVIINLFAFSPKIAIAAAAPDCPQVIAQAKTYRDQTLKNSIAAHDQALRNWLSSNRGSVPTQAAITAGKDAVNALINYQGQVTNVATKECSKTEFDSLYASLKSEANRYNIFRESAKDPGGTGGESAPYQNTSAFTPANISYEEASTNPNAANCSAIYSKLASLVPASERELILLEQAEQVHNSEIGAEYKNNVEPIEIKASAAWQLASDALQEAARLGCDKSDPAKFQSFRDPMKNQADRINTVREKLSKSRLTLAATVDQTIQNVKDSFASCKDCETAGEKLPILIKSIFSSLCCLMSEFVSAFRKAVNERAKQTGLYLQNNT